MFFASETEKLKKNTSARHVFAVSKLDGGIRFFVFRYLAFEMD